MFGTVIVLSLSPASSNMNFSNWLVGTLEGFLRGAPPPSPSAALIWLQWVLITLCSLTLR